MKRKVIPTVFAKNKKEFKERFEKLVGISRELQIDFMDGNFVWSKGIKLGDVGELKKYREKKFEAHLMVRDPEKWIGKLKKKGFSKVIFHVEIKKDIQKIINLIRDNNMSVWIAINPSTKVDRVVKYLEQVDGVLFMGVVPGREGQKFISRVLGKIKKLRGLDKRIKIQVDGGVNLKNIRSIVKAGVDIVNTGSFVFGAEDPKKALKELSKKFN